MRRAAVLAAAALASALAGCGTPSADLFAVERTGSIEGARLNLIIGDGGAVQCDGRAGSRLTDQQLLDARELERDLAKEAERGLRLPRNPNSVLQYTVHGGDGTVSFADNSRGKPPVLDRLVFFVRQVAQQRCGLPR